MECSRCGYTSDDPEEFEGGLCIWCADELLQQREEHWEEDEGIEHYYDSEDWEEW